MSRSSKGILSGLSESNIDSTNKSTNTNENNSNSDSNNASISIPKNTKKKSEEKVFVGFYIKNDNMKFLKKLMAKNGYDPKNDKSKFINELLESLQEGLDGK